MHFEILVEGQADRTALETLLAKILGRYGEENTWRIHKHQGRGKLPEDPRIAPNGRDRTLLHNLPASLRAYGQSLKAHQAVVVVVDLDDGDCVEFKRQLLALLDSCSPRPTCLFRFAIEELEAWFLGDRDAVVKAYPKAVVSVLESYAQDSICGTWEFLAEAVYPGGARKLKAMGRSRRPLEQKQEWAKAIVPLMDVEGNRSPSFRVFRDGLRRLADRSR